MLTNKEVRNYTKGRKGLIFFLSATLLFSSGKAISLVPKVEQQRRVENKLHAEYNKNNQFIISDVVVYPKERTIDGNNIFYILDDNIYSLEMGSKDSRNLDHQLDLKAGYTSLSIMENIVTEALLSNIGLRDSEITKLSFSHVYANNGILNHFPSSLVYLSLSDNVLISSLSKLPDICPKIEILHIENLPNITDFDFILKLKNLKEVYFGDSAYITEELLINLKSRGITTDITKLDVTISKNIDEIVSKITNNTMTDKEKIISISNFILNNFKYDLSLVRESNKQPLKCFFEHQAGVCVSYSFLTNVLLNKAGINTISVYNIEHAWNTVNLDGKIYNLDNTYNTSLKNYEEIDLNMWASFFSPSMELEKIKLLETALKSVESKRLDIDHIRKLFFGSKAFNIMFDSLINSSVYHNALTNEFVIEALPFRILLDIRNGMQKEELAKKYSINIGAVDWTSKLEIKLYEGLSVILALLLLATKMLFEDLEKKEQYKVR